MNHPLARLLSLLLALSCSALILLYPQGFTAADGKADHSLLMPLLAGNAIGFIHGVGFNPVNKLSRIILGPIVGWPVMLYGIVLVGLSLPA
jgi:cyd operon protein YbgE